MVKTEKKVKIIATTSGYISKVTLRTTRSVLRSLSLQIIRRCSIVREGGKTDQIMTLLVYLQ